MNDADAQGMDEMQDHRFPALRMESGCLRMRSRVQVYQWKETETTSKPAGGGEISTTWYNYRQIWSDTQIDSTSFREKSHSNSISVAGLTCGTDSRTNTTVGQDGYYLPKDMVEQLDNWKNANSQVQTLEYNGNRFGNPSEGWSYYPESAAQSPTVGSVRVCLEYVTDGPVSIVALQTQDDRHPRAASFLPYRLVSRGLCCGPRDEALQDALLTQGRKSSSELKKEDLERELHVNNVPDPLQIIFDQQRMEAAVLALQEEWTLGCNLIAKRFAALAPPQIFAAYPGHSTVAEVFDKLATSVRVWKLRLLSWLLLYAGTYALFKPLLVVLDILPFLGPYISSGAGWVIGVVVFLATAVLATLVISVAFLRYQPLVGLTCMAGAVTARTRHSSHDGISIAR
ncbi:Tmem43 [Symbiodinium sp. CCMP2456]|nr:Tmem43 [Symbiodinium sp. CCMP2456]